MKSLRCAALGWHSWPRWRRVVRKRADDPPADYIEVRRCRRCGKRQVRPVDQKAMEANEAELRG